MSLLIAIRQATWDCEALHVIGLHGSGDKISAGTKWKRRRGWFGLPSFQFCCSVYTLCLFGMNVGFQTCLGLRLSCFSALSQVLHAYREMQCNHFSVFFRAIDVPALVMPSFESGATSLSSQITDKTELINACFGNGCCSVCFRCAVSNHQNRYRVGTAIVTHARIFILESMLMSDAKVLVHSDCTKSCTERDLMLEDFRRLVVWDFLDLFSQSALCD